MEAKNKTTSTLPAALKPIWKEKKPKVYEMNERENYVITVKNKRDCTNIESSSVTIECEYGELSYCSVIFLLLELTIICRV